MARITDDLLDQADHLAAVESGRPKQASLRRAVSAAYYALFHLLAGEASERFLGPSSPWVEHIVRAFVRIPAIVIAKIGPS